MEAVVSQLCEARADLRYQTIREDALAEIADAEAEWKESDDAYQSQKQETEKALADAAQQIADGKVQLETAAEEIARQEKELADGELALKESEELLADQQLPI